MPIDAPWRKLIPEQVRNVPDYAGVFECADILQDLVYIGSTDSLLRTMEMMLDRKDPDFNLVNFFRFQALNNHAEEAAKLIDAYRQQHNRLPLINQKKAQS